ncbi:NAD(P)H-dependent oxidoreductase [uncultured Trichococcus sp.]|uniref:NAD(P)H-dependent oxidoreductase n=1 Tax=uncultured Trichococcus sp. TaxID=189665 RepID=UPI0029C978CC|nr:NAD(P)H-dependent oxidoreductase [uncultured Trichococcus sp.]
MQTLIIVSHPTLADSNTQRFLWESLPAEGVTWHHLESAYPDGQIDQEAEQLQLLQYDRIIFQFPFYWYSSPALLKQWQDIVLTEGFAYGADGSRLSGKEFGLVLALGVNEREYQAGGREGFTISELTRPYQAMATKCGMVFLPSLVVSKFDYLNDTKKKELLIAYQQYLTKDNDASLKSSENWFKLQLQSLGKAGLSEEDQQLVELLITQLEENREQLDDLAWMLAEMEGNQLG